eukprot:SRR837773.18646.p1 GENE.SRR837773.18646~~SRR837773.18646.p1  ORF type:complete len:291 (+),score=81.88 SRR837773.18646:67-873(+)
MWGGGKGKGGGWGGCGGGWGGAAWGKGGGWGGAWGGGWGGKGDAWGKGAWGGMKGGMGGGGNVGKVNPKKVFVGALPQSPNEDTIREYFAQFGTVTDLKMVKDNQGTSRGYCFVTFEDEAVAKTVIEANGQHSLDGQTLDVKTSAPNPGVSAKPGDWFCPNCGDLVFAKRSSCNACGFTGGCGGCGKVGGSGRPGDWVCPSCSDVVFAQKSQCGKCGADRTPDAKRLNMKPGDWICPGCGNLCFQTRTDCKLCGAVKPDGAGARATPY